MRNNMLQKVKEYKNMAVVSRIQTEFGLNEREAKILFEDTKMFLFLSTKTDQAINPTSKIDKGWHTFLMFTKDYAQFCFDCLGIFVHHTPFKPGHVADTKMPSALSLAQKYFGEQCSFSQNWIPEKGARVNCAPDTNCEPEPADCALNVDNGFAWTT